MLRRNNDVDLKITQLNANSMNNSIESLDVSTISESETEPDLVKEIIAPIYSTFTIQTPSSSQLVEEDFIPSAQFEEEIALAPTQSQIFNNK